MKKALIALIAAVVAAAVPAAAAAAEFSADVTYKEAGRTMNSRIYVAGDRMRTEMDVRDAYQIVRQDLKKSWLVMPGKDQYMEMKLDPQSVPQERMRGEISRKQIGKETIDGHPTEKYEVTYREGGKTLKSHQWVATDIKFPIKAAALDGSWTMEYRNIKMGKQPTSLFEVPKGYRKIEIHGSDVTVTK